MSATITELDYALNCAATEIDTTNARSELAALRAAAAELHAARALAGVVDGVPLSAWIDEELQLSRDARAERDELRATVQAQAAQLKQALVLFVELTDALGHHADIDAWIAANAPQDVKPAA